MDKSKSIQNALIVEPHRNLTEMVSLAGHNTTAAGTDAATKVGTGNVSTPDACVLARISELNEMSPVARRLGQDAVNYVSALRERQERLGLSARQVENGKSELVNRGLAKEIWIGKSLYLAATEKLYTLCGLPCPYPRNRWEIHSFLVYLAGKLVGINPLVRSVKAEEPVDEKGKTVDLHVCLKNGDRHAYEITHRCTGNISSNATKLQGKSYSQIIFLCTDWNIKQSVWTMLQNAGFDPDFFSTLRCMIFSELIRQKRQWEGTKS